MKKNKCNSIARVCLLPGGCCLLLVFVLSCSNNSSKDVKNSSPGDSVSKAVVPNDPFEKNGEEKIKYENGVLKSQGNYKKSKRDGQWYSWYSDGKPWSETFFNNGIKEGPTKTWFENGKLRYEGQYKQDSEAGKWKYYDETGKLAKEINYDKR